jgi:hypothetical protein
MYNKIHGNNHCKKAIEFIICKKRRLKQGDVSAKVIYQVRTCKMPVPRKEAGCDPPALVSGSAADI